MAVDAKVGRAAALKVLGEPMRWEIVRRLAVEDLCTCHLVEDLDAAQPLVSHHLKVLREAGLVSTEACGSFTYYILDRGVLAELAATVATLVADSGPGTGAGPSPRAAPAPRRPCS